MRVDEIVSKANKAEGSHSEKDAVDYFKRNNMGHWPSERGEITINGTNGEINLNIGRKMIGSNQDLTPSAKIWLINKFFNDIQPVALKDIQSIEQYSHKGRKLKAKETPHPQEFHHRIIKRMSTSFTQFVRSGNTRLAFVERKRLNNDNSTVYSYDINILDCDKTSKYALMLPGLKPVIQVFEEYQGNIVKSPIVVDGRVFEGMEPWERAEYIAMTPIDIFDYQKVSQQYLDAAFLLTEALDANSQTQFLNV